MMFCIHAAKFLVVTNVLELTQQTQLYQGLKAYASSDFYKPRSEILAILYIIIFLTLYLTNTPAMPPRITNRLDISTILDQIHEVFPSESLPKPGYRPCLTNYGLVKRSFDEAATSNTPMRQYKNLLEAAKTLRQRLHTLPRIPEQMTTALDDLDLAVGEMIGLGDAGIKDVDEKEAAQGPEEIVQESKLPQVSQGPEKIVQKPEPLPVSIKINKNPTVMRQKDSQVPQRHYNRVKEELKEEKENNQKLSDENNRLVRELRMVKIERDVLRRRVVDG
jgi:hypothetical protein